MAEGVAVGIIAVAVVALRRRLAVGIIAVAVVALRRRRLAGGGPRSVAVWTAPWPASARP
jgi:hypothetical protein